jgi:hypothetical protein
MISLIPWTLVQHVSKWTSLYLGICLLSSLTKHWKIKSVAVALRQDWLTCLGVPLGKSVIFTTLLPILLHLWPSFGKTQPKSFFSDDNVYVFINLCHVQNILCKGHHITLKYFVSYYILKCWSWKKVIVLDIFEVWIKELYWNTINFNDIRCNFKAFLHFGMDKMYQRGIFNKKNKNTFLNFPLFLQILPGNFGRVFP